MRIGPYIGKPHTLHTHLSSDECWWHLRDEVYAHPALIKPGKWQPFRYERLIERKINGDRFMLRSENATKWMVRGNISWYLYGSINQRDELSRITVQYRLGWPDLVVWYMWTVLMSSITLFGVVILVGLLDRVEAGLLNFAFGGTLVVSGAFMLVMLYRRAQEHEGEAWLIDRLKQLLEAEDA